MNEWLLNVYSGTDKDGLAGSYKNDPDLICVADGRKPDQQTTDDRISPFSEVISERTLSHFHGCPRSRTEKICDW